MNLKKIKKAYLRLPFLKGKPLLWLQIAKGYFRGIVLRQDVLRSVELAVSFKCNLNCDKCYSNDLHDPKKKDMSVQDIRKLWRQCHKLGAMHVNITGGEPLLRKDIFDIMKALKPRSTMISLVTNVTPLTRDMVFALKKAGLSSLHLSLDSHIPEVHDKSRGVKGLYNKVMQAVEWGHEAGVVVCFSTVVAPNTIDDMPKMVDLAMKKKCFLILCTAAAVGGWENNPKALLNKKQLLEADRIRKETDITTQGLEFNFSGKAGCPAGREKIYISSYGEVYPCNIGSHKSFGNVFKEPLRVIHKRMCKHPLYKKQSKLCLRYLHVYNS